MLAMEIALVVSTAGLAHVTYYAIPPDARPHYLKIYVWCVHLGKKCLWEITVRLPRKRG